MSKLRKRQAGIQETAKTGTGNKPVQQQVSRRGKPDTGRKAQGDVCMRKWNSQDQFMCLPGMGHGEEYSGI